MKKHPTPIVAQSRMRNQQTKPVQAEPQAKLINPLNILMDMMGTIGDASSQLMKNPLIPGPLIFDLIESRDTMQLILLEIQKNDPSQR